MRSMSNAKITVIQSPFFFQSICDLFWEHQQRSRLETWYVFTHTLMELVTPAMDQ